MAKVVYEYQGREYATMLAVATAVGVKRVYPKDFERLGVTVIDVKKDKEESKKVAEAKKAEVKTSEPVVKEAKKAEVKTSEPVVKEAKKAEVKKTNPEPTEVEKVVPKLKKRQPQKVEKPVVKKEVEPSEDCIVFCNSLKAMSLEELKKFSLTVLDKQFVEKYSAMEPRIARMKLTMELKQAKFPKTEFKTLAFRPSPFAKIPFDMLLDYVEKNNISYIKVKNQAVLRMRVIQGLLQAGVVPEDIVVTTEKAGK